jgi:hypothetical protein
LAYLLHTRVLCVRERTEKEILRNIKIQFRKRYRKKTKEENKSLEKEKLKVK